MLKIFGVNGLEKEVVEKSDYTSNYFCNTNNWKSFQQNDDLNNLGLGCYYTNSDSVISSIKNKPTESITQMDESYFICFGIANDLCFQVYIGGGVSSTFIWTRTKRGGSLTPWKAH